MKPGSVGRKNHDIGKLVIFVTQPFQAAAAVPKQSCHYLLTGLKWFSFAWEESHLMSRLLVWCPPACDQAIAAARPFGRRALAATAAVLWVNKGGNTKLQRHTIKCVCQECLFDCWFVWSSMSSIPLSVFFNIQDHVMWQNWFWPRPLSLIVEGKHTHCCLSNSLRTLLTALCWFEMR